jgi:L-2-hydroxyglutarate oxidase LhgO
MDEVDCIVAGAGVVGLAVARALAQAGREVLVLEAAEAMGTGTSSRNSEVIHAGLYYPPGSLKARLCVAGRQALYAYCGTRGIPHRRCGKLIVATDEAEIATLGDIATRAAANGVDDLRLLGAAEATALEPAIACVAALHSPSTGIVDSHALMQALEADAAVAGATVVFRTPIAGGDVAGGRIVIRTGGDAPMALACRLLVNCAGLGASALVAGLAGFPAAFVPELRLAKGNYFVLAGSAPFSRLIYPVPVPGGLGVHLTLDLAGAARFGPDVEWVEHIDYDVDPTRSEGFHAAIGRYWPGVAGRSLEPGYSGIRPKAVRPGSDGDFIIDGPEAHGVPGVISLGGIESPGLTAALAIGDHVAAMAAATR